jgi:chitodextrinase
MIKRKNKISMRETTKKYITYGGSVLFIAIFATIGFQILGGSHAATVATDGPTSPPAEVCGNASTLSGPASAPAGAVSVASGNDSSVAFNTPNTTYWFAPGTHTLGTGEYSSITPAQGDTFVGAPGAILSGQGSNNYAFVASYEAPYVSDVTIEYLTIENFTPPQSQGAVNQNSGPGWTFKYDTIQDNAPGAGLFLGNNDVASYNCLTENGQYGFQGYSGYETDALTGGPDNISLSNNEVSYNNTCNLEGVSPNPVPSADRPSNCGTVTTDNGCGCTGGGKFWEVNNATVENNYVHNNYSVGMWADTNNNGFTFKNNYISDNYSIGIQYEVSYNALIENNTFLDNAWGSGEANPGFPEGAIYISESGGDSRVPNTAGIKTITISNNTFTNNWSGVVLWENANRFCSNGLPTTECTLVDPSVATVSACQSALGNANEDKSTDSPDYFDLCRWKTQNVLVADNAFNVTPADISTDCTASRYCGTNALFSEYGSNAPYTGATVPTNIAFNQNNVFTGNTYSGPWSFMAWSQGNLDYPISWAAWSAAVTDKCSTAGEISSGTCDSGFGQEAGSTYNSQSVPTPATKPTVPANVDAKANSSSSVTVSWTASSDNGGSGIAGYYVYRNGAQVANVGASAVSYTDTSVAATTQYSYTVEAYDTASPPNVSALSTAATVETPGAATSSTQAAPSVPTNVKAASSSPTSVNVSWTASSETGGSTSSSTAASSTPSPDGSISCDYRDNTWSSDASKDGYSITDLSSKNGNPASFSIQTNATKGNTEVVAYPDVQCLLYSALPANLTSSFDITPPAASSGLDYEYAYDIWLTSASAAESNNWSNDLELMIWNYVNGQVPAGSDMATLSDGSKVWVAGNNSAGTVSVVLPNNETTGTVDIASIVSQLKSLGYITNNDTGILDVEYGIEAPYGGNQTFSVKSLSTSESASTSGGSTSSSPTIAGYYVLRNGVNVTPNMLTGTSYTDSSVVSNTSYSYAVEAIDTAKNISAPSTAATVETPSPVDTTPPTQPTSLTSTVVSSSQINLQWKASTDKDGVSGYRIYRNGALIATATTTSYGDAELKASTKYSYYVIAFDGAGNQSTPSATVSATTQAVSQTMTTTEGKVTNEKTGKPLVGVYVHTGTIATKKGMAFTYTNSSGSYVLSNLIPNKSHYYAFSLKGFQNKDINVTFDPGVHTENIQLMQLLSSKE